MNASEPFVRLRGGATLVNPTVGRFAATWPLGLIEITDDGVRISISLTPDSWQASWADIDRAMFTPNSVVLFRKADRGARFLALSTRRFAPVLGVLRAHGVPMEQVSSTIRGNWKI